MATEMIRMSDVILTDEECNERISRIYYEQLLPLESALELRGLRFSLCGSMIHVSSSHESWFICIHVRTGRMLLLHQSVSRPHDAKAPHYHEQACRSDSLSEVLCYIIEHDDMRAGAAADYAARMARKEQHRREKQQRLQSRRRLARCLSRLEMQAALDMAELEAAV